MLLKSLLIPVKVLSIGSLSKMDDYERRKISIFNLLNCLGFIIGIFLPIMGLTLENIQLSTFSWMVTFAPGMVSIMVLVLNYYRLHEIAILTYFILYPVFTALVYLVSFDIGIELFFILYGVLSVFFLRRLLFIVIAFTLTIVCYFYVFVFTRHYDVQLVEMNFPFYVLNHVLPAGFIFYALFLIKRENTQYQQRLIKKNNELRLVNLEIQNKNALIDEKARLLQEQNAIIDEKAKLLEKQTAELTELNSMKNKLFSVISHDLKTPLYALRNLFRSVEQFDLPAEQIKEFVPEVVKNLNYTTALMENLLIWVKSQMQINLKNPQLLDMATLVQEATDVLRLQASSKEIIVEHRIKTRTHVYGDKEMISLVIRNLLSNAIKFTPHKGSIIISIQVKDDVVEVAVKDNGVGMNATMVSQLFENTYHSTKGTADETGTGLGLMLCKDFLIKNGGDIHVESAPGKGSTFSFTLPRKAQ